MDTQKIVQFINRNRLFSPEEKILVALSGGADSVALLHLLLSAGYTCEAAHCNFISGTQSPTGMKHLSATYAMRGTYLCTPFILTRNGKPKDGTSPLKWRQGNCGMPGLKKYAKMRRRRHRRRTPPGRQCGNLSAQPHPGNRHQRLAGNTSQERKSSASAIMYWPQGNHKLS